MRISRLKGKAQTVLGLIEPDKLGVTLSHEHLSIDMRGFFSETIGHEELAQQSISLDNLGWIRSHRMSNLENLQPFTEQEIVAEALLFKNAGGNTIVEVTPNNMGRDPVKLRKVAQTIGLNIIMGTAYYRETAAAWNADKNSDLAVKDLGNYPKTFMDFAREEEIASEFVRDIAVGIVHHFVCKLALAVIAGSECGRWSW